MASPSVQLNTFKPTTHFRASTSHPDLAQAGLVDSLIRHKLETSDQTIQTLAQQLKGERDRNRILEAQVTSLEGVITQLLSQAEQYHYEALVNEKRVKELEAKLEKEVTKRGAQVKTAKNLETAVDRVKYLEKQLKTQIDSRMNESLSDDQLAWSVVETSALRTKVRELEKEVSLQKHYIKSERNSSSAEPQDLTPEMAYDVAEVALIKDRIATDIKFSETKSGPAEEFAYCVAENAALKERVNELAGVQAVKEVEEIESHVKLHQKDAVNDQLEQLKSLEAEYSKLSAACNELESRRTSIAPEVVRTVLADSVESYGGLDEQLAYALVENRILRDQSN